MQKISILVDNDYLDLFEDTDFTITKQSFILGEPDARKMDFTSNIKIPYTEYNKQLLGINYLAANRRESRQFIPNVNLEFENIQIIVNGYLKVNSIGVDFIEISVIQDLKDITQRLSYKNLKDIRLQTTDGRINSPVVAYSDTNPFFSLGDMVLTTSPAYGDIAGLGYAPSFANYEFINTQQRYKVYFKGLDAATATLPSKYLSWKEVFTTAIMAHREVEVFEFGKITGVGSFDPTDKDGFYRPFDFFYQPNMVSTLHSIFAQVFETTSDVYDERHNGGFLIVGNVLEELNDIFYSHGTPYLYYGTNLEFTGNNRDGLVDWDTIQAQTGFPTVNGAPLYFVPSTIFSMTNYDDQRFTFMLFAERIYTHLNPTVTNIRLEFNWTGNVVEYKYVVGTPPGTFPPIEVTYRNTVIVKHYDSGGTLITTGENYINIVTLNTGDYIEVEAVYDVTYVMPPALNSLYSYIYNFSSVEIRMSQNRYGSQLGENAGISAASLFYDMNQLDFVKEVCNTFLLNFDIEYNQPVIDSDNNLLGYTNTISFWRLSELLENVGSAYDWTNKVENEFIDVPYSLLELHAEDYSQLSTIDFSNSDEYADVANVNTEDITINYVPGSYIGGLLSDKEETISGNYVRHTNGFQIPIFVNDETLDKESSVVSLKSVYFYDKLCKNTARPPFSAPEFRNLLYIPSFTKPTGGPAPYEDYEFKQPEFGFFKVKPYNKPRVNIFGNVIGTSPDDTTFFLLLDPVNYFQIDMGTMGSPLNEGKGDYFYTHVTEFLKNNIFSDYQRLTVRVKLTLDEINNFKFKYPVYLAQTESYYYVEKIEGYSSKDELSTVYLIKLTIN